MLRGWAEGLRRNIQAEPGTASPPRWANKREHGGLQTGKLLLKQACGEEGRVGRC